MTHHSGSVRAVLFDCQWNDRVKVVSWVSSIAHSIWPFLHLHLNYMAQSPQGGNSSELSKDWSSFIEPEGSYTKNVLTKACCPSISRSSKKYFLFWFWNLIEYALWFLPCMLYYPSLPPSFYHPSNMPFILRSFSFLPSSLHYFVSLSYKYNILLNIKTQAIKWWGHLNRMEDIKLVKKITDWDFLGIRTEGW